MVRISALLLLTTLLSACPPATSRPPAVVKAASSAALEIQSFSETQPFTSLAVLKGSLYAGTPAGVVRFDLESRQHVRLAREQGLPGNQVFALSGHPSSGLWVATDGGVSRFQDGVWSNIPAPPGSREVTAMVAVADGVWAGGQGLARLRGGEWKRFLPGGHVTVLRADLMGEGVWVGTEGEGVYQVRGDTLISHSLSQGQPLRKIQSLAFTREGGLIAVGQDDQQRHGLTFFDGKHWTSIAVEPAGHLTWAERVGDDVLLAYDDRILALERLGPGAQPATAKPAPGAVRLVSTRSSLAPASTPVPQFVTRAVDRWLPGDPTVVLGHGRRVFIGTRTSGAAAYDGQRVTWYRTRDLTGGRERLGVGCVTGGGCYLASSGRALRLGPDGFCPAAVDSDSGLRVQTFLETPGGLRALSLGADGQTLVVSQWDGKQFGRAFESKLTLPEGRAEVHFARLAPDGKIWVGLAYVDGEGVTRPWGVAMVAPGTPTVYHRSTLLPSEDRAPGSLALPDDIRDVLFAGEDTWFSTSAGICRVRGSRVDLFTENEGLESEMVYTLVRGPSGHLYAASHGGVGHFDGKWWRFDLGGMLSADTRALVPRGEDLWAATRAGLVRWSPRSSRLIDSRQGLAGDRGLDLYLEADRRIWVLTDGGLSIVSL